MQQSPVKPVGAFLDTLVLNVYPTNSEFVQEKRRVPADLQEELAFLKEQAQDAEEELPTRFFFEGSPLLMTRKGEGGFQWILKNTKLTVAVNRGAKMSLLAQVRCSSEYLWSVRDLGKIVSSVHVFLTSLFGQYILIQPSALDLALDVVGFDVGSVQDIKQHFVRRAQLTDQRPLDEHVIDGPENIPERWGRVTGLPFGARAAAVSALLYDKQHEITYKSKEKSWFYDLWLQVKDEKGEPVWDGTSPVWRIEVRFRRAALSEMMQKDVFHGIDDAYTLESHLAGLWSYAVGHVGGGEDGLPDGWLRYVTPSEDKNRSRWPVHPDWEVIQAAFIEALTPAPLPLSDLELQEQEQEVLLQEVDVYLAEHPWSSDAAAAPALLLSSGVDLPTSTDPARFDLKPYIRKRKRQKNMKQLVAQIVGCMVTVEAWRSREDEEDTYDPTVTPDISSTFHYVYRQAEDLLEEKALKTQREYPDLVNNKRVLYSVEVAA